MTSTASPETEQADLRIGTTVAGKYVVDGIIGEGAMGTVLSAVHKELDERVAVKFLKPEMALHEEAVQRFLREAKLAAKLKSDHTVRVFDVGRTEDGAPYMAMEFLVGGDLEEELRRRGPLPPREVADWIQQAVAALAEAHVLGIVHRDLKPSNLFLATRRRTKIVKVLDFGISKLETEKASLSLTSTRAILGSPLYMSPEQIRSSRSVDHRSDLWSLGVVMYQLLTDQLPFMTEEDSVGELFGLIQHTEPRPLRAVRPEIDPGLEAIVMHCLKKNRDERFPDVGKLAEALQAHSSATSVGLVEFTKNAVRSLPPPANPSLSELKIPVNVPANLPLPKIVGESGKMALAATATRSLPPKGVIPVATPAPHVRATNAPSHPVNGLGPAKVLALAAAALLLVIGAGFAAFRMSASPKEASASPGTTADVPVEPPKVPASAVPSGVVPSAVVPGEPSAVPTVTPTAVVAPSTAPTVPPSSPHVAKGTSKRATTDTPVVASKPVSRPASAPPPAAPKDRGF
ncbi:MAG: protein kinase [Polyangiaceae bacterium]